MKIQKKIRRGGVRVGGGSGRVGGRGKCERRSEVLCENSIFFFFFFWGGGGRVGCGGGSG